MRQLLRATTLVVLGFVVFPLFAADEKKADDKKDVEKKDVEKKAPETVAAGTVTGQILSKDETKRTLKLQITLQEINPDAVRGINQATLDLQRAALEPNPQQRLQKINQAQTQLAQHRSKLYRDKKQDVDITTTEDVKVRLGKPPGKFDEKGKPVEYTAKELKELKGEDTKTPGYPAEFSDLHPKQIVQITLVKKKGTPVIPKPDPAVKGKDVDKVSTADILAEYAPQASMIVVVLDPTPR